MAKGPSIKRKLNDGRGMIDINNPDKYKPWIHCRELARGNGRRHIINDLKYPNRAIHLMSDLEEDVYYKLRENALVLELFEQVALDPRITFKICCDLGIKHPMVPIKNEPAIMTTDFVAYIDCGHGCEYRAYSVKLSEELESERTREKLKIEQAYWEQYSGVCWSIITEDYVK